jgi:hypothetical protein
MDIMKDKEIRNVLRALGLTFIVKYIYCGKKGCRTCPHGPYLYVSQREDGKVRTKYLGRADVQLLMRRDEVLARLSQLEMEYEEKRKRLEEEYRKKVISLVQDLLLEEHPD